MLYELDTSIGLHTVTVIEKNKGIVTTTVYHNKDYSTTPDMVDYITSYWAGLDKNQLLDKINNQRDEINNEIAKQEKERQELKDKEERELMEDNKEFIEEILPVFNKYNKCICGKVYTIRQDEKAITEIEDGNLSFYVTSLHN